MSICYLGPLLDYSGYGEANRHDVAALVAAGVPTVGKLVSYVTEKPDFGPIGEVVHKVINTNEDYKIKVIHTTPNQFPKYREEGKYNIGRLFWETDKLPHDFAEGCNAMDELWTGSEANKAAAIKAGVTKPIYVIPQAIETDREFPEKYEIEDMEPGTFLFYSIFEWTDRKNPRALLEAFWNEFQNGEKVALLIKTYFRDFSFYNRRKILDDIALYKSKSGLEKFPPVFLYRELMDRRQITRLHMTGDCFVSAHRGEGWGLPQTEAMLAGKPIISTGYAGVHEYLEHGKDAILLDYKMVPVRGMSHSSFWYTSDQNWADPEIKHLRLALRRMYEDRDFARHLGKNGRKTVLTKFNLLAVGNIMAARLKEIEDSL